jgi:hypothetical protein
MLLRNNGQTFNMSAYKAAFSPEPSAQGEGPYGVVNLHSEGEGESLGPPGHMTTYLSREGLLYVHTSAGIKGVSRLTFKFSMLCPR